MGSANLLPTLVGPKATQTQQHTEFAVLETVSSGETVFHRRAK